MISLVPQENDIEAWHTWVNNYSPLLSRKHLEDHVIGLWKSCRCDLPSYFLRRGYYDVPKIERWSGTRKLFFACIRKIVGCLYHSEYVKRRLREALGEEEGRLVRAQSSIAPETFYAGERAALAPQRPSWTLPSTNRAGPWPKSQGYGGRSIGAQDPPVPRISRSSNVSQNSPITQSEQNSSRILPSQLKRSHPLFSSKNAFSSLDNCQEPENTVPVLSERSDNRSLQTPNTPFAQTSENIQPNPIPIPSGNSHHATISLTSRKQDQSVGTKRDQHSLQKSTPEPGASLLRWEQSMRSSDDNTDTDEATLSKRHCQNSSQSPLTNSRTHHGHSSSSATRSTELMHSSPHSNAMSPSAAPPAGNPNLSSN